MQLSKLNYDDRETYAWSMLDRETIFMTGGTGFFGTSLLYSLFNAKKNRFFHVFARNNLYIFIVVSEQARKKYRTLFSFSFFFFILRVSWQKREILF